MGNRAPMFLPIRDHNPSARKPFVTWSLIGLNVLIFVSYWGKIDNPYLIAGFFHDWAMTPSLITKGYNSYSLVTYMFLHGGLLHLAGNMLFLWIFGDNLEDELGHIGFLLFYLAAGVGAALAQIMVDPSSKIQVVGASGAIAGIMGGYLLLFPKAKIDILFLIIVFFKIFSLRAWVVLGIWFGIQIFSTVSPGASEGVAWMAHVGGFVIGVALMLVPWLNRGGPAFWEKTQGHPPHPDAKYGKLTRSSVPTVRRRK